ncbi:MAG: hypothetical protein J7M34_02285 [Anaerolineae bacterium]|nr:hypothetical protein [Anaerolineae bacterium]
MGRRLRVSISLRQVWAALPALVLLAAVWGLGEIAPHDFWWHVRTGQLMLEMKHIPHVDLYTFTHFHEPWTYQAWLMEIGLYLIYRTGGAPLTLFVHAIVIVAGYILVQRELVRITHGDMPLAAVATIGGAVLGEQNWAVRPQSISFLFFGLTLSLLLRYEEKQGAQLWWLPIIFLVWVNAHGGFIFGLALVGAFAVGKLWDVYRSGERRWPVRDLMLPLALTVFVLALNPVGPMGIVKYVLGFVRSPGTRTLNAEFRPTTIRTLTGALFTFVSLVLVSVLVWSRYRPAAWETIALVGFGLLALWAIRDPPWFGFVAAPVIARAKTYAVPRPKLASRGRPWANAVILGLLIIMAIICLPWFRSAFPAWNRHRSVIKRGTPIAATAYICEHLPSDARVFNEMGYGSYMIWGCPRLPVFIDTRIELYSFQELKEYLAIGFGRYDWQQLLARYGITHLLLSREVQPHLIEAADASPCWEELYRDRYSVVFARRMGGTCSGR